MRGVVGIRGAITVDANTPEAILGAARELLRRIITANAVEEDEVAGIFFTTTPDLDAEFPAYAVRDMGWVRTAALCAREIPVPGAMPGVIRVMMFVNDRERNAVRHQYLGRARALRPDLVEEPGVS